MGTKVDDIVAKFPIKTLPRIVGEPEYSTINDLVQTLYGNAATLETTLGGGNHGHIGLIMKPQLYATLSGTPYAAPNDPGATPTIPHGATATQREQARMDHAVLRKIYENHANMDVALKTLLLEAVEECYVNELRNRYTGYLGVSTLDIIDHLMDRYGKISPSALKENEDAMKEPIDTSVPIDVYFKRIDDAVQFAADGDTPFTTEQILHTAFHAILTTGLYTDEAKAWRKKDAADKTWANFKTHFAEAYHDMRETQKLTAGAGGFHAANAMYDIGAALDNLANAATADRGIVTELTSANAQLVKTNQKLTDQVAALAKQLQQAMQTIESMANSKGGHSGGGGGGGNGGGGRKPNWDPNGYCWSCGYKVTKGHNGKTCWSKKAGHQEQATRADTMGGSTANKNWKPEE